MPFTRRRVLAAALPAALVADGCGFRTPPVAESSPFRHGVASGDPLADRVIIWTRLTPDRPGPIPVEWSVEEPGSSAAPVAAGAAMARAESDYTVKVDVTGLAPARRYVYRFRALGHESPSGRTRTAPVGAVDRARFAVVSCAELPAGYFNAYAAIAADADLDAVVHLGDYLYEQAHRDYGTGRRHEPEHEIVSLEDYRARHAQYKADPDLQAAHRNHPFIAVWDDHESADNSWRDGALNHDPGEGEWAARKRAAIQAYYEWMPIRGTPTGPDTRIFRRFGYGDLADLIMLDTRLFGRDRQPGDPNDLETINDPARSILGAVQHDWLDARLTESRARWRIVGQQLMFGQLGYPDGRIRNVDQWDGYPASRARVLDTIENNGLRNVVVLTGDLHSSWAMELHRDPYRDRSRPLAVELIAPPVTAYAFRVATPEDARAQERWLLEELPHVAFTDQWHRGYLAVEVTPEAVVGDWRFVETFTERNPAVYSGARFRVDSGTNRLTRVP